MKAFVSWLAIPLAALALALWVELRVPGTDAGDVPAFSAIDDPKLARTVLSFDSGLGSDRERAGIPIHLRIENEKLEALRSGSRKRMFAEIRFDRGPLREAIIKARGNSSFAFRRKSLSVELSEGIRFGENRLRRFLLLSLVSDPHRFEMYTSYRLLQRIALFPAYFQYVTLYMNDSVEGTYLLMERPQDAIRRRWPDVRCITRLRRDGVELEFSKTSDPYSLVRKLQRPSNTLAHDAEVQALERLVDLEHYFRWLAFNSLVENADSRNELFVFELPTDSGEGRLDLLPWDYDDLQEPPARPLQVLTEPLFYASEMRLDRRIHENPKLRERYQRELRRLLEEDLTADVLTDTLADVARRLQRLEGARVTDQQERAHAMMGFEQRLLERRTELLDLVRPAQ